MDYVEEDVQTQEDLDLKAKKPTKHDEQGAADLERVTDFHEEIELTGGICDIVQNLKSVKKDNQLPKIKVKTEDINFIVNEMEVSNKIAESKLKENNGDIVQTIWAMVNE